MPSQFGANVGVADDGAITVDFYGELDLAVTDAMRDVLVAAGSGGRIVRVDLSDVTFLDSSGIALLARYGQELAGGGGRLQVAATSYQVRRVLEIAGLVTSNAWFDVL